MSDLLYQHPFMQQWGFVSYTSTTKIVKPGGVLFVAGKEEGPTN